MFSLLRKFFGNVAFGTFLGVEATIFLFWALSAEENTFLQTHASNIYTLSASLFAASLALAGVFFTIENQNRAERERNRRQFLAALAMLPVSLSRLTELAYDGIALSDRFRLSNYGEEELHALRQAGEKRLRLTDEIVSILQDLIRFGEADITTDRIRIILRNYQIFYARWTGLFSDRHNNLANIEETERSRVVEWAYLCALVGTLFNFARGDEKTPENTVEYVDIRGPLRRALGVQYDLEQFSVEIERMTRWFESHDKYAPTNS